ncbi:MAG: hypothetical protein M3Z16_07300 [Pseudomonadota bacterium]|nr:hypothetical protein [Pseudomonadota bacterium]
MKRLQTMLVAGLAGLAFGGVLAAEPRSGPSIFSCLQLDGRRTTSDRPVQCPREQRELNTDGSTKRILAPMLSPEEMANIDQKARDDEVEQKARREAARRDSSLIKRFPGDAEHRRARNAALEEIKASIANNEKRIAILRSERKKIDEELEFYQPPKRPPAKLKAQADANDAAMNAQRQLIQNLEAEFVRMNEKFDAELAYLKKLWSGALPGSLGAPPAPTPNVKPQPVRTPG